MKRREFLGSLGALGIALPSVGMAAASHNTNQTTTAQFRDLALAGGRTVETVSLPFEPLGPSSRRTGLVISEVMYHPSFRPDGTNLEFVELFNTLPYFEELSGYRLMHKPLRPARLRALLGGVWRDRSALARAPEEHAPA